MAGIRDPPPPPFICYFVLLVAEFACLGLRSFYKAYVSLVLRLPCPGEEK